MPLALSGAWALTIMGGFAACGVSGCSGGGFGPSYDHRPLSALLVITAGAVLAMPLMLIRWAPRRGVRLGVAAAIAIGWSLWSWFTINGVI